MEDTWMSDERFDTHSFFARFATIVAKAMGSHWSFAVVSALVVLSMLAFGLATTNFVISAATLLMVFVLQNTQNRDSAALHLKLDEMVRVQPEARDRLRGAETKPQTEIDELHEDLREEVEEANEDRRGVGVNAPS
jgi:low affinity Fe/Cu permease